MKYLLILFILSFKLFSEEIIYHKNINSFQKQELEKMFSLLETLKEDKEITRSDFYQSKSNFKTLFGFSFNGFLLKNWILKRIQTVYLSNSNLFIAEYSNGKIYLSKVFFYLSDIDRLAIFIHEARHGDGDGYSHVNCPENFKFLSYRNPEIDLSNKKACDLVADGAYGFSASFLFELIAFGIGNKESLVGKYNSELSRIISN